MPTTYKRFVILSTARTGSSMLVQALNSHPQIVCFREVLNNRHDFVDFSVEGYDNFSPKERERRSEDPVAFVQDRIYCAWPESVAAVGFKLLYGQAWDFPDVVERLQADPHLYVLHLKRRNMLRTLTSLKLARQTDVWFEEQQPASKLTRTNLMRVLRHPSSAIGAVQRMTKRPKPAATPVRVAISPSELFEFHVSMNMRMAHHDAAFAAHPKMELFYEDLVAEREETLAAAETFLGVEPAALTTTLKRQNPEPLRELVENYDELYEAFKDTPDAPFFDG